MKTYEEMLTVIDGVADKYYDDLTAFSDDLADHPETAMEEFHACACYKSMLESHGWDVVTPFCGMETGFFASFGKQGRSKKVAIMAEYDALPGLGHACGHCVSGSMSLLAALALADLQDELDTDVHLIGTPAEEGFGAKIDYVAAGIFDDYDAAIMIHIDDKNVMAPILRALGMAEITFHGKSAHAAAAPWEGVNALNAAQLYLHALDMMRQHVTNDVQFHSVIVEGGVVPGIVPDKTVVRTFFRCLRGKELPHLKEIVDNCAKGAAIATGCSYELENNVDTKRAYIDLKPNPTGFKAFEDIYNEMGLPVTVPVVPWASTDAGNVSYACPAFQPTLKMIPEGTALHTPAVEQTVRTEEGHQAIKTGAKILARWVAKVFSDPEKLAAIKEDFATIE